MTLKHYLHELSDKEHAAGLQAGSIKLHNVAVMQRSQHPHLQPTSCEDPT